MKLKLTHEKGIEVLVAGGTIADHEIKVLRAGLSSILKTGKNKIILDLPDSSDLSTEVIREIATFDGLARELSGRIVLVGIGPGLQAKIESFSKPPTILCFANRSKAFEFLLAPPASAGAEAVRETPGALSQTSREELLTLKSSEHVLKARVGTLEKEVERLKKQIILVTLERRNPANEAEYVDRIKYLEDKLEKSLAEVVQAPPVASGAKR